MEREIKSPYVPPKDKIILDKDV